jgi:uncharacterized membrane protein
MPPVADRRRRVRPRPSHAGTLASRHQLRGYCVHLLTGWDLVLDPAMARTGLTLNFWIWHQSGPYFGMPIHNFVGWTVTGRVFMGLSRRLWGADALSISARIPLALYTLNVVFAMLLSAAGSVWAPIAIVLLVMSIAASMVVVQPLRRGRPLPTPSALG